MEDHPSGHKNVLVFGDTLMLLNSYTLCQEYECSSPSILQPFILRPSLITRPPNLVLNCHCVLNDLCFKTTCNIRPHFLGPIGGLKIKVCICTYVVL